LLLYSYLQFSLLARKANRLKAVMPLLTASKYIMKYMGMAAHWPGACHAISHFARLFAYQCNDAKGLVTINDSTLFECAIE
jgi:hypothetical protein